MLRKVFTGVVVILATATATAADAATVSVADGALSNHSPHAVWSSAEFVDTDGRPDAVDARLVAEGEAKVRVATAPLLPGLGRTGLGACAVNRSLLEATCRGVCVGDPVNGFVKCVEPVLAGFFADLGAGNDSVTATGFDATRLIGGSGRDRIVGGAGDDSVGAADGEADTIRCGAGEDFAVADALDSVDASCETVVRF